MQKFISIKEAISTGLIPADYAEYFEPISKCCCGDDIVINTNRTIMKCSNPDCINILSRRLLYAYNNFGNTGIGPVTIKEIISTYGVKSVKEGLLCGASNVSNAFAEWVERPHMAYEVMKILYLPRIGESTCQKIFTEIKDVSELYLYAMYYGERRYSREHGFKTASKENWEVFWSCENKVPFQTFLNSIGDCFPIPVEEKSWEEFKQNIFYNGLRDVLQLQLGGDGTLSDAITEILIQYWSEIVYMFSICTCIEPIMNVEKIVITGDIILVTPERGGYFGREEFVEYVNELARVKGLQFVNSTALKSSRWIIADTPSNTRKYVEGKTQGKLITSAEFVELIKRGDF